MKSNLPGRPEVLVVVSSSGPDTEGKNSKTTEDDQEEKERSEGTDSRHVCFVNELSRENAREKDLAIVAV